LFVAISPLLSAVCDGVAVRVRPGLTEFLTKLAEHFEVGIFTAAEEVYACPVLDTIDPTGLISFRLYRDATVEHNGVSFVKDLSRLGRDMRRTVLIDNNIQATLASPDNSLVCVDYYGDPADNELPGACPCLSLFFLFCLQSLTFFCFVQRSAQVVHGNGCDD
jgi:RNA polymerase II subunit A small phosphatase-like protein